MSAPGRGHFLTVALSSLLLGCANSGGGNASPSLGAGDSAALEFSVEPLPAMVAAVLAVPADDTLEPSEREQPRQLVRRGGGTRCGAHTESSVQRPRRWFEQTQADDGSWPAVDARDTPATTALVLLTMAHAGHSLRVGRFKSRVRKGLKYLKALSRADPGRPGRIGPDYADGRHRYNQALATLTLVEHYGLSGSLAVKAIAENALAQLLGMQSARGGWPLGDGSQRDDTALTIWAALALRAAQRSEMAGVDESLAAAVKSLEAVTDATGRATWTSDNMLGARPAAVRWAPSLDTLQAGVLAVRLATRSLTPKDVLAQTAAANLLAAPPRWDHNGGNDVIRFWFGTIAQFHMGGDDWVRWNRALKAALVKSQRLGKEHYGTWDAKLALADPSAGELGVTSLAVLSLTIYYRYPGTSFGDKKN